MQDLDWQIEYWNRIGPTKPFRHPVNLERLKEWLFPDSRILDFGCGFGRVLGLLQRGGFRNLIGVDPAPEMVAAVHRSFPIIEVEVLTSPARVGVPPDSIDAVLLISVLTCIPTDMGQHAIIQEVSRILRPGGLLYISDLWVQEDARNVQRYKRDEPKYGTYGVFDLPEGVTVRHHARRWIKALTAGYQPISLDDVQVETMNGNQATGFQWFGLKPP